MTSGDLLELFREEMDDLEVPYLWNDDLIFGYVDDAQTMFCRLTDGIADATTPAVAQIAIQPGVEWYATNPAIKLLRQANRSDTGKPVDVINQDDMARREWHFNGRPGVPRALVWGIEPAKVRVWPMPDASARVSLATIANALLGDVTLLFASTVGLIRGQSVSGTGVAPNTTVQALTATTVTLSAPLTAAVTLGDTIVFDLTVLISVFRTPLVRIVDDQPLEVPSEHHPHLLMWVKHRAYMKQNAETFDRTKAKEFKDAFAAYCFEVQVEQRRARHKTRVVSYGGI